MNPDPVADRPVMPGYGLAEDGILLPWSWAVERLTASRNYWVSTTSADGRPHSMPLWATWHDNRLYFSTGAESKKARNLRRDSRCTITTEHAGEAVVVEGTAAIETDREVLAAFVAQYRAKYDWAMEPDGIWRVTPARAFGFIEADDQFTSTATRWTFA